MKAILHSILFVSFMVNTTLINVISIHYCHGHFSGLRIAVPSDDGCCGGTKKEMDCCKDMLLQSRISEALHDSNTQKIIYDQTVLSTCFHHLLEVDNSITIAYSFPIVSTNDETDNNFKDFFKIHQRIFYS